MKERIGANFNSIKVRLELTECAYGMCNCYNFNSIKVRLEHDDPVELKGE